MSNREDQEREARLRPKRIESCVETLTAMGFACTNDNTKVTFEYKGHKVILYPYSGWHTGKSIKDGRGFEKLLKQLK
jgi:hypothetical protein